MRAREQLTTCLSLALLAVAGCDAGARAPAPALSAEAPVNVAPAPPAEPAPAPAPTSAGTDPRLPVLGDPLGLLSKPVAGGAAAQPPGEPRGKKLDPSALMGSAPGAQPAAAELARDPRAVERARAELAARPSAAAARGPLQEKSAHEVVRRASQGGARVHVLLLYASYCKACRGVMPSFVQLVRAYKARGVAFTAASVDGDREAFAAYAAVLEEALEPIWILPDSGTKAELKRAGIKLPDDSLSIPLFAVFAGQNRVVAQGHSRELRDLPDTLDALL